MPIIAGVHEFLFLFLYIETFFTKNLFSLVFLCFLWFFFLALAHSSTNLLKCSCLEVESGTFVDAEHDVHVLYCLTDGSLE